MVRNTEILMLFIAGSRTMWNTVEAEPVYTTKEDNFEKLVTVTQNEYTIIYLATSKL